MSLYPTPSNRRPYFHKYEQPFSGGFMRSVSSFYNSAYTPGEDLSGSLPTEAVMAGFELFAVKPPEERDPWFLYQNGRIVYRWDKLPSLTAAAEKCRELMGGNQWTTRLK